MKIIEKQNCSGKVINGKRDKLELPQRSIAEKIHMNNATIWTRFKSAYGASDIKTLRKISNALNIDYNYLLSINGSIDREPEL